MDSVGEGEGGKIWENGTETHTSPYAEQTASGNLLHATWSSSRTLCDSLEGWDGRETTPETRQIIEVCM